MNTLEAPIIKTKDPNSRWVALDFEDRHTIIAEAVEPADVIKVANELGKEFFLSFVPKPGDTYIL